MASIKSHIIKYKILVKRGLAKNPALNSISIKRKVARVSKLRDFVITANELSFYFKGRKVRFLYRNESELEDIADILKENFVEDQYKEIDVNGRDLVDIGAGIGDTAIYFIVNGARHVYAFEPFPYRFRIGQRNINANRLGKRVTLVNEGCAGEDTFVKADKSYKSGAGSALEDKGRGGRIRVRSLDHIVKRFKLSNAVLKLDCEGCEYDVILKSGANALGAFRSMVIEYHYGYEALVKHLKEAGFSVRYTEPRHNYSVEERRHMMMGLIIAEKK